MPEQTIRQRDEIEEKYKWDISSVYSDVETWRKDLDSAVEEAGEFCRFRGTLADSAINLADAFDAESSFSMKLERVLVYAKMKSDEDNRVSESLEMNTLAGTAAAKISALTSWMMPELISVPEEKIRRFLEEEPRLAVYRHILETALREKAHVLSPENEDILAQLGEVLGAPDEIFGMLNDADLKFGKIRDEAGNETELTHGNYIRFMRSFDRRVRKDAYDLCYSAYKGHINTIAANYSVNVKTDVIISRLRNYSSSRAAALSGDNIPESVYDNLTASVNGTLSSLHEYTALRKELLGLDELKMYDVYVPLVTLEEQNITFEKAVDMACEGLYPLGEEYLSDFRRGIAERWIDVYENEGKTSGAYSFGSYDSKPFVLLNYDGTLNDVFTIAHEMGHSLNSLYTRRTQPYVYGGHSIFTAEVASTVNETLLMKHLISVTEDPEMKKYLLNMYIEAFRTTLFRQTMFAEFEQLAHVRVEEGDALTPEWLSDTYQDLNDRYFGPALDRDDMIRFEWARIPHFYRSYYVYQYATGYSAANAIVTKILTEGAPARDAYLKFLGTGNSDDPVELLKIAGIDMSSEEPVDTAMDTFRELVATFRKLMTE